MRISTLTSTSGNRWAMLVIASGWATIVMSAKWRPRDSLAPQVPAIQQPIIAIVTSPKSSTKKYPTLIKMREFGPIIGGSFAPNRQPKLAAPINEDSGGRSISHNKYLKMILIGLGSTFASSVKASNDL